MRSLRAGGVHGSIARPFFLPYHRRLFTIVYRLWEFIMSNIETVRQQSITLLEGMASMFADTSVSDRVAMGLSYVRQGYNPNHALSAFLPTRTTSAWKPEVTLADLVGIIKLAHRNGLIDNDSYVGFKQFHLDQKELLRGENVADAITMLQRQLDAFARRTR